MTASDPPPISGQWGLVSPRAASAIALAVFILVAVVSLIGITYYAATGAGRPDKQAVSTTVKTTEVHGATGAASAGPPTTTTETTTETSSAEPGLLDRLVTPPVWFLLELGVALLAAFVTAGVTQRVLLGRYGFTFGPLSLQEISGQTVASVGETAIRGLQTAVASSPGVDGAPKAAETGSTAMLPTSSMDPNLALVALRIEIERRLTSLAGTADIAGPPRNSTRRMIDLLTRQGVLPYPVAEALLRLVDLGNRAAHGVEVAPEAGTWAQDEGPRLLAALDALIAQQTE